jgi:uncharacterized protein YlxW (UPF0749 family)
MGLLRYITETSMDEDYAHVAQAKATAGTGRSRPGIGGLVILALFGGLLAVAGVQTAREAPDAASSKQYLVNRVNQGKRDLAIKQEEITGLQKSVARIQSQFLGISAAGSGMQSRLSRLGALTGANPVTGPGVRLVVNDAPNALSDSQRVLDSDLQGLVNGLWQVGAEAIAINGERLTSLSAIREAGGAITVDYRSLNPPYVVSAIGDPNNLATLFVETPGVQTFLVEQARYGLRFSINSEDPVTLPAANHLSLRFARVAGAR